MSAEGSGGSSADREAKRKRGDGRSIQHDVYVHESSESLLDRRVKAATSKLELLTKMYPDMHEKVRQAREELLNLYDQVLN
jgi:hypothetical protein